MNLRDFSVFALLAVAAGHVAHADVVERIEAIANKKPIFKSDVDQFRKLKPLRSKIDPIFANDPMAKKENPSDYEIVNFLIDESLIVDKFPVPDPEVEQEINGIQANLKIDREQLREAIAREGFKFEEYFKLMRTSLSKRQLLDREIRNKASVSDDDLTAEYNRQHSGSKSFHGSFHVFLIRISKSNFKTYELAKDQVKKTMDALKRGDPFEEVAKRDSDDPSQGNGGDLGFLSYGEMSPTIQKEVQKLDPGKVSDIAEDNRSFVIVKITEIKAEGDPEFEKEKDSLRAKLLEKEFQHQIRLWIDHQRTVSFVSTNIKP